MITLEQYVGIYKQSTDWTAETEANAIKLLIACCALEAVLVGANIPFPQNLKTGSQISGETYGGFRPQACPIGAPKSAHKRGLAVDRYDPTEQIDNYLMAHPELLEKHGVYIEHPSATLGWSHWSIQPPKSGKHIFYPQGN